MRSPAPCSLASWLVGLCPGQAQNKRLSAVMNACACRAACEQLHLVAVCPGCFVWRRVRVSLCAMKHTKLITVSQ